MYSKWETAGVCVATYQTVLVRHKRMVIDVTLTVLIRRKPAKTFTYSQTCNSQQSQWIWCRKKGRSLQIVCVYAWLRDFINCKIVPCIWMGTVSWLMSLWCICHGTRWYRCYLLVQLHSRWNGWHCQDSIQYVQACQFSFWLIFSLFHTEIRGWNKGIRQNNIAI